MEMLVSKSDKATLAIKQQQLAIQHPRSKLRYTQRPWPLIFQKKRPNEQRAWGITTDQVPLRPEAMTDMLWSKCADS